MWYRPRHIVNGWYPMGLIHGTTHQVELLMVWCAIKKEGERRWALAGENAIDWTACHVTRDRVCRNLKPQRYGLVQILC